LARRTIVAMMRVLIADPEGLVRKGLRFLLEEDPGISVVAEASNGDEAVSEYERCRPDVAVLEIAMPQGEGLATIRQLVSSDRDARILVVTKLDPRLFAVRAFKAGAMGYMTKSSPASGLPSAVHSVRSRRRCFLNEETNAVGPHLPADFSDDSPVRNLSNRELQVLWLVARGHKLTTIADTLGLGNKTVGTYRERFSRKLDIRTDADVYRFARRNGLA
jgi:two-component system, NarL family, invasion response regulator UvrY